MSILFNSYSKKYGFLSNFTDSEVYGYPSVEAAYQACKTVIPKERERFKKAKSGKHAKAMGYYITVRPEWTDAMFRIKVMWTLCKRKFEILHLREKLEATGNVELIHDTSAWKDNFWGNATSHNDPGMNWHGRILMSIRAGEDYESFVHRITDVEKERANRTLFAGA